MAYQPNIPTGQVNLDVDYANLQNNFQQLDTTFGVDHTTFSNATSQNGYHTAIHLISQATPTPTAGVGIVTNNIVNDGIDTDEILYFLTEKNKLLQLTRNFVPTKAANGSTFLPGGLILNWGRFTRGTSWPGSSTALNFSGGNQNYPSSNYGVLVSLTGTPGPSSGDVAIVSISNTGFVWNTNISSSALTGFYWWSIGS